MVLADEELQRELRDLTDRDEFIARVVELGADRDLIFSNEAVMEALRTAKREWIERSI
jgi:hypothetical protein